MRTRSGALAIIFLLSAGISAGAADTAKDIPANHWAKKDVAAALQHGIMRAPNGKFNGDARVTRTDLIIAMAGFGQSLEHNTWLPGKPGRRFKFPLKDADPTVEQGLTRYELATVLTRMGGYAASALPKPGPKRFAASIVLPAPSEVTTVPKTDPAYASVQYLAKNRMIGKDSILSKPGTQPVTGKDVAEAITAVVAAVSDMNTDEPQNREDLGPPPNSKGPARGTPSKLGGGKQ